MIILYIIGILFSVAVFAPNNIIPFFVKWPVALIGVLLIVFFFNLPKKDTIYTTHDNKKRLYDFGLFNPLLMYLSANCYILGFNMILTFLIGKGMTDIIANISNIPSLITFDFKNNLFLGLILVVVAILLYAFRNAFRKNASKTSLICRSAWYVALTLFALGLGVYSYLGYQAFNIYDYLTVGYNLYVYFGLVALVILIDVICLIIEAVSRSKKAKLEAELLVLTEQNGGEPLTQEQIKAHKRSKVVEKERLRMEKKLSKKEAKINKKLAKIEERKRKKQERANKRINKLK